MKYKLPVNPRWLWLTAGAILVIIVAATIISRSLSPWLKEKLEAMVEEQSQGLYTLQLHSLDASVLSGRIITDSISLKPDVKVWEQLSANAKDSIAASQVPRMLLDLTTHTVQIGGVNLLGIWRGKPLDVSLLHVQYPVLVITEMRADTTRQHEPLHASATGIVKGLQVNRFKIEEGTIRIRTRTNAAVDMTALEDFNLMIKDFRLDSSSFNDKNRAYYAEKMILEKGKATFQLPDGSYKFQAGALKANTAEGTLNIGNLKVVPLLKNSEMSRRQGMAVSTLSAEVPEINISGISYKAHSKYNNLVAGLVAVKNPSLSAYMDRKNFPQGGNKPLPHDLLQNIKTGLTIDKIKVEGMHVRYEELAPEAKEPGIITFENLNVTFTNVTNDRNRISPENPAILQVKGRINGNAPLAVTGKFHLLDPQGFHTLKGTIGPANAATLNTIVAPTAFISIKEGRLLESSFDLQLYRNKATGNTKIRYQNFKVDLLSKDKDEHQSFGMKVLSRVANKVVIASDNPSEGEALRPGPVNVVRAKSRSVFNYWKDCLVSGFRSAAGIEGVGADLQDPNRK